MPYFVSSDKNFAVDTDEIALIMMPYEVSAVLEMKNERKIQMPEAAARELIEFIRVNHSPDNAVPLRTV